MMTKTKKKLPPSQLEDTFARIAGTHKDGPNAPIRPLFWNGKKLSVKETLLSEHRRGDHAGRKRPRCLLCQGKEVECRDCLMLFCHGCETNHCAKHCRGKKPNAIRYNRQYTKDD